MDMDIELPLLKLQIITLLDSTCYGLIYAFLGPYVVGLGATQFIVGCMSVGNLFCTLLSSHIIGNFSQIHGKRYALYMILNTAMVSHIMLVLTGCYWFTILCRFVFSLTNQSQNLCRDLLLEAAPEERKKCFSRKCSVLNGAGIIIGPFIAGCLFDRGFEYVCLLAAALTSINIYLVLTLPLEEERSRHRVSSISAKTKNDICNTIQDLKNAELENNWDILAMKYLYLSSILIFSTKFTQILRHNYHSSQFIMGFINSYMNALNFAGAYFIDSVKNKYFPDTPILKAIQYGLLTSGTLVLFSCYSPVFFLFTLLCGPIFFSFNFMNTNWTEISLTRENDSLNELTKYIRIAVGLTVPLLFGLTHFVIGYHAAILFSTVPIFVSACILKKYTSVLYMENGEKVKQD